MNSQIESQFRSKSVSAIAPAHRASPSEWMPSVPCVEMEQENARLRLALREAQHRAGNQWQLLLGLAELEYRHTPPSAVGSNVRLRAMMSAFATLNKVLDTDADTLLGRHKVRVGAALESILALLQTTIEEEALSFAVQDAWLSEKGCAALMLICAELVCNATKYGQKTTRVTFRVEEEQGILAVRDDGPGFPEGFRVEEQERQGLQLVKTLCRFDLNGEMRCHNSAQGGVVTLTFPVLSQLPEEQPAVEANETFCAMDGIVCFNALSK